jgi:hypothetical protein
LKNYKKYLNEQQIGHKERKMVVGYGRTEKLKLKENSAVIVFDQDGDNHSFQLMLPGMMTYDEAPENVRAAVIVAAFLRYDDKDFRKLVLDKGMSYYDEYVTETIVEDLPEEK